MAFRLSRTLQAIPNAFRPSRTTNPLAQMLERAPEIRDVGRDFMLRGGESKIESPFEVVQRLLVEVPRERGDRDGAGNEEDEHHRGVLWIGLFQAAEAPACER